MKIGDWVQSTEQISEGPEDGGGLTETVTLAEPGAVGHVVEVVDDVCVFVFWERTGMATIVCVDQLTLLGDADTGRAAV